MYILEDQKEQRGSEAPGTIGDQANDSVQPDSRGQSLGGQYEPQDGKGGQRSTKQQAG